MTSGTTPRQGDWYATLWLGRWEVHRIVSPAHPWERERRAYLKRTGGGSIFRTTSEDHARRVAAVVNRDQAKATRSARLYALKDHFGEVGARP